MNIERLDTAVPDEWIRVGLVRLTFKPRLSAPPRDFGWHLHDCFKQAVEVLLASGK